MRRRPTQRTPEWEWTVLRVLRAERAAKYGTTDTNPELERAKAEAAEAGVDVIRFLADVRKELT